MASRACNARKEDGSPCQAPPLKDADFCLVHDPAHADEMRAARQLGGSRRRKEAALAIAFDFQGLTTIDDIRRLIEVAIVDAFALENSIARVRALAYLAQIAASLLEKGELADRMAALEAALGPRLVKPEYPKRRSWLGR